MKKLVAASVAIISFFVFVRERFDRASADVVYRHEKIGGRK